MTPAIEERLVVALEGIAAALSAQQEPARLRGGGPVGGIVGPFEQTDVGDADRPVQPLCVDAIKFAQLLDISERSLHRLDDAGKVPAGINLGGCKRWPVREIESWIAARCPSRKEWNLRSGVADPRAGEGVMSPTTTRTARGSRST